MSSPDYYSVSNGPAATQHSEDSEDPFITYCLTLSFILFCAFPLVMYFKDSILQTFSCIGDSIHHISLVSHTFSTHFMDYIPNGKHLSSYSPRTSIFNNPRPANHSSRYHHHLMNFFTEVREQLIILTQTLPPLDKFLTEVREQLIISSSTEQILSIQDIQQEYSDSQVFQTEQLLLLHTPNIFIEWTHSPPVICNHRAFTKFIQGEEIH